MKLFTRWLIVILIAASVLLSACSQPPKPAAGEKPSRLEEIAGSEFKKVFLTEKAAERIGIETVQVTEQAVNRKMTIGGVVVEPMSTRSIGTLNPKAKAWIRIRVADDDVDELNMEAAEILPLDDEDAFEKFNAKAIEIQDGDDVGDDEDSRFFEIDDEDSALEVGDRVFVNLPLAGSGQRKTVPYAAVIYGVQGETWVYTNPEPLVFVRAPIVIDYIDGDQVILSEGPEAGTSIVIVGVAELFGAETGVSK